MSQKESFPNIAIINDSIRLLYRRLTAAKVRSFAIGSLIDDVGSFPWSDPVIATQHLARRIALHYRLSFATVIVSFSSTLPVPGRVELSRTNDFYIEIHSDHRWQPSSIAAILSHEIAHIFLHAHSIKVEPTFNNEVLTDTTATYLGCGVLILNGLVETEQRVSAEKVKVNQRHFGYLTLNEFGYLLAKRSLVFGETPSPKLKRGGAYKAFVNGSERLDTERETRPFVPRPLFDRLNCWAQVHLLRKNPESAPIVFQCPCCSQSLRAVSDQKKHRLRCATCQFLLPSVVTRPSLLLTFSTRLRLSQFKRGSLYPELPRIRARSLGEVERAGDEGAEARGRGEVRRARGGSGAGVLRPGIRHCQCLPQGWCRS